MRERPIIFSSPMIRAILDGRKTVTRRVVRLPRWLAIVDGDLDRAHPDLLWGATPGLHVPCADGTQQRLRNPWCWPEPVRLWVREAWAPHPLDGCDPPERVLYRADGANYDASRLNEGIHVTRGPRILDYVEPGEWMPGEWMPDRWRPSIHMPRWASRIQLDVVGVRVERLHAIDDADVEAEGIGYNPAAAAALAAGDSSRKAWAAGWDAINGKRAPWASNPWVWRVEFRRVAGGA